MLFLMLHWLATHFFLRVKSYWQWQRIISSNCVANIYYILRKAGGNSQARKFISTIVKYITVITIDHKNVLEALKSKFSDFEDALQYYSAIEHQCEYIITRNIEDYKNTEIPVLLPEEFIRMFQ